MYKHKFKAPPGVELQEGAKHFLDELNLGAEGWTFIVEPKDDNDKYPQSNTEIALWVECPGIEAVSVEIGECEKDEASGSSMRRVSYHIKTDTVEASSWTMDFGDGHSESAEGVPPNVISHLYAAKPQTSPTLTLLGGHSACEGQSMAVELATFDNFEPCHDCPKISQVSVDFGECVADGDAKKREVFFTVTLEGDAPASWSMDFGDGTQEQGTGTPPEKFTHLYAEKPQSAPVFSLTGEHTSCEGQSKEVDLSSFDNFEPCHECPKITQISVVYGECVEDGDVNKREVVFKVALTGDAPSNWVMDFGDGTKQDGTGTPPSEFTHLYSDKPENNPTFSISSESSCEDQSSEVELSGFEKCTCPELKEIKVLSHSNETQQSTRVVLEAIMKGGSPDKYIWDLGDGTKKETKGPKIEHRYTRPHTVREEVTISLTTEGPGACTASDSISLHIDPRPEIIEDPKGPTLPKPPLCRLFLYIVPFLLSLFWGSALVCYVADTVENNQDAVSQLMLFAGIFFLAAGICLIIWHQRCKLTRCDGILVGWTSTFAATLVSMYLQNCCNMVGSTLFFAIVTIALFAWGFKSCLQDRKVVGFYLLAIAILAAAIATLGFADGYLACV